MFGVYHNQDYLDILQGSREVVDFLIKFIDLCIQNLIFGIDSHVENDALLRIDMNQVKCGRWNCPNSRMD